MQLLLSSVKSDGKITIRSVSPSRYLKSVNEVGLESRQGKKEIEVIHATFWKSDFRENFRQFV